jgi:hypothetical protein
MKYARSILVLLAFSGACAVVLAGAAVAADDGSCQRLSAAVTGEERKYAVTADAYGPAAFADISCAVYWRNNKFCATEMATFDVTAKTVDYHTGEEVQMARAHFVLNAPGEKKVVAFAAREDAEKFVAQGGGGSILGYTQLTVAAFD